ncbi:MAG: nucleotidyltransferase domain-containing protein [Nitrospirota bacterium]
MRLYALKYLFLLIFEGEKTSRELAELAGDRIYNTSHAMSILQNLGLVRHPQNRLRSWEIIPTIKLNLLLEKLLLISKNDKEIKRLLEQPAVIKIGSNIYKNKRGRSISSLVESAGISKRTVMRVLNKLVELNLLKKTGGKPHAFHVSNTTSAQVFFEACGRIENLFRSKARKQVPVSPAQAIKEMAKDNSVLILIHYGSSSRGKADNLSDIDVLAVTRDKISRGDILHRYSHKKLDLNVYSKRGFLQLIKTQPDFIRNISTARVLKGDDILKAIMQ